jgi:hypothetical protein
MLGVGWRLYRQHPQGAKPAELPVQQAVKVDFVINRGTATQAV